MQTASITLPTPPPVTISTGAPSIAATRALLSPKTEPTPL